MHTWSNEWPKPCCSESGVLSSEAGFKFLRLVRACNCVLQNNKCKQKETLALFEKILEGRGFCFFSMKWFVMTYFVLKQFKSLPCLLKEFKLHYPRDKEQDKTWFFSLVGMGIHLRAKRPAFWSPDYFCSCILWLFNVQYHKYRFLGSKETPDFTPLQNKAEKGGLLLIQYVSTVE